MTNRASIDPECRDAIIAVLEEIPSVQKAVLFGSRAKGTAKPHSDVDIALYGNVDVFEAEDVSCRLNELPFIQKFDVVAFNLVENAELREHIERVGVEIFTRRL